MRKYRILVLFYLYATLHVLGWIALLHLNDHESFAPTLKLTYLVLFLPLNVLNYLQILLVWGTLNVFAAKVVFGLIADFAAMSFISIHLLYVAVRIISGPWKGNYVKRTSKSAMH